MRKHHYPRSSGGALELHDIYPRTQNEPLAESGFEPCISEASATVLDLSQAPPAPRCQHPESSISKRADNTDRRWLRSMTGEGVKAWAVLSAVQTH